MEIKRNLFAAFALLMLVPTFTWAKPRTKAEMKRTALSAINLQVAESKHNLRAPQQGGTKAASQLRELKRTGTYTVFGYNDGGFAIIAADDLAPELLAVSDTRFEQSDNPGLNWWLKAVDEVITTAVKINKPLETVSPVLKGYPAEVSPMITTKWGQQAPYNNLLPSAKSGRLLTGCVATAMAQVMNFFAYPEHGRGENTIYYPYGDTNGAAISADFTNTTYDWANMKDDYKTGYTDVEAKAVATLMLHCGVASDMHYGGPDKGSGTVMPECVNGLKRFFGFTEAEAMSRSKYNAGQWMELVFTELAKGRPLIYSGVSPGSTGIDAGHAFVLDGYNSSGLVSVNWGWEGKDNGYFRIDLLNPNYMYSFKDHQEFVRGVYGPEKQLEKRTIELPQAGVLGEKIPANMRTKISDLTLKGNINAADLKVIREMAGCDDAGKSTRGELSMLDLKEARFVSGGGIYLQDGQLTTADDNLPERSFYGCKSLKKVVLPSVIKTISDGTFAYCRSLETVENLPTNGGDNFVYDGGVFYNKERTELISVIPFTQDDITVPEGVTTLHNYAFAGCKNFKKVVLPKTLAAFGKESMAACASLTEIKIFAKQPPTLGKEAFRDTRTDAIRLFVPAGSKASYKGWANITAKNIREFGTMLIVHDATRKYGEPNPKFNYTVRGEFPEGKPEITCEANEKSAVGKYEIRIDYGTLTDKSIELVGGTLTVEKNVLAVSVEDVIRAVNTPNPEFVLHYDGFKNGETEQVLTVRPTATTTATEDSPIGEYEITVSGGEAQNYTFTYTNGKLKIVSPADGISPAEASATATPQPVYSVSGTKVGTTATLSSLPRGVYVVNKKKVVVK